MTNCERKPRPRLLRRHLLAAAAAVGGLVCFTGAQAFAAGTLQVSRATGLVQGEVVQVAGTGLASSAYGYILECNETPGEPTAHVGAPFDESIPIGCSPPSLKHIVNTSATGTLSTNYEVHVSRRLGPPCSSNSVFGPCGPADSAGKRPRSDAQNFPCPPSPAQQAAGVSCSLVFYDTEQQVVSTPIAFLGGGGPAPKTPPTTSPPVTRPTSPAPPTTAPATPPTTAHTSPGSGSGGTGGSGSTGASGSGSGGSGSTGAATPVGAATAVKAPSSSLAFTGLGMPGKVLAVVGGLLVLVGLVLFFVNLKRLAFWLLGH